MTPVPFVASDLETFTDIADVQVAADGATVAVATSRPDLASNGYDRQILLVDVASGTHAPSGLGPGARLPRWSPVAATLAAVRPADDGSQLVLAADDAQPTVLCTSPDAIEELAWSPDGQWLLFVVREPVDREYWRTPVERRPPLRLTALHYQEDSLGFVVGRPRQAYLVAAAGGEASRLSAGGFDDAEFSWHPDSQSVVFVSQRHDGRDRTLHNDVFTQRIAGGDPVRLTSTQCLFGTPVVSPDGATVACTTMDVSRFPANVEVAVLPVTGGSPSVVTTALDRDCFDLVWHSGTSLAATVHDSGAIHYYELPVDGGDARLLLGGERRVGTVARAADELVFVTSSATQPPRVETEAGRVLFAPNEATTAARAVHAPVRRSVPTAPGVEVDSWLTLPDPDRFSAPYPLLVCLQGGGTQYGQVWSHEFQLLNTAGFATLCLNARGSAGYGEGWARSVSGPAADPPGSGWGTVDIDDVAAVVEATLRATPELDADRVGVQGGSYGALVTTWLLARTDLFRAGWAERGPYNLYSLAGSNDESPWFFDTYLGVSQLDDPAAYWTPSPLRVATSITAPLAIVHSEFDRRCPIQQAEELFMALRIAGREVEFIRFPGESHELTRSGSPVHRVQRLELLLEWFGRWLRP